MRTLIVGASLTGVRVARNLRARGSDDELLLMGAETDLPYDRPCLSKAMLAGDITTDDNVLLGDDEARDLDIKLVLGRTARSLDRAARVVHMDGGPVPFDRLVVATGLTARRLPWADLPGVHVLRSAADCAAVRAGLTAGGRVVVVGGGFIGCEVAATARRLGVEVILIEPCTTLLPVAGPELGALVGDLHVGHGVDVRLGVSVEDVAVSESGGLLVRLSDSDVVSTQAVVLGIGASPNVAWLKGSGLDLTNGVACDPWGRAMLVGGEITDDVFAVGDVARWHDPRGRESRRLEHWTNACEQASAVARVLSGEDPRHHESGEQGVPPHVPNSYVWSDQYDWTFHLVGAREDAVDVVQLGTGQAGQVALLGRDASGVLSFAAVAGWPRALLAVRRGITSGARASDIASQLAPPVATLGTTGHEPNAVAQSSAGPNDDERNPDHGI